MWFQRRYLRCLMQIPAQADAGICAGRYRYLRFLGLFRLKKIRLLKNRTIHSISLQCGVRDVSHGVSLEQESEVVSNNFRAFIL